MLGAPNGFLGVHYLRNGYSLNNIGEADENLSKFGQLKATSLTIRNPIGTGVSGSAPAGDPTHHYGCFVGPSSDEFDHELAYLPPTGEQPANILPRITNHSTLGPER